MKTVSAKSVVKLLNLTREYYADLLRPEQDNKELLKKRLQIANELENETGVSWYAWENIISGVYDLNNKITNKEVFAVIRVLGFNVVEDDDD